MHYFMGERCSLAPERLVDMDLQRSVSVWEVVSVF